MRVNGAVQSRYNLLGSFGPLARSTTNPTWPIRRLGSRNPVVQACLRQASLRGRPVRRRVRNRVSVPVYIERGKAAALQVGLVSSTDKENERRAARNQAYL